MGGGGVSASCVRSSFLCPQDPSQRVLVFSGGEGGWGHCFETRVSTMAPKKTKNKPQPKAAPKSQVRVVKTTTEKFLEPSTEKREHHPIAMPPRMLRALAMNQSSPGAQNALAYIRTKQDVFYGALLAHFLDESLHYSLPGIRMPFLAGQSFNFWGSYAESATTDARRIAPAQRGTPALPTTSMQQDYNSSRYGVFQGAYQTEPSFTTDSNGKLYLWAIFNPLEYDYPVKYINMADPTNPALDSNTKAGTWFDNPFAMQVNWNTSPFLEEEKPAATPTPPACACGSCDYERVSDKPKVGIAPIAQSTSDIDEYNLYYTGGAALTVSCMKTDDQISVAMRARTTDNVVNRFYQGVDNIYSNDQLGFTTPYVNTNAAHAFHSGNKWDFLTRGKGGVIPGSVANENLYGVKAFQKAWQAGEPFIQIVVQTVAPNTTVRFSVSARAWIGVAPMRLASAGVMPLETAPFELPTWFSFARSGAGYGKHDVAQRASSNMQIANLLPALTSEVPLLRQVASSPAPRQMIEAVAQHPRVAQHNGLESVVESIGGATLGGLIVNKVGPVAKSWLANRGKQLASYAVQRLLPGMLEGAETALPLLAAAL